jgi:hypothetical protein
MPFITSTTGRRLGTADSLGGQHQQRQQASFRRTAEVLHVQAVVAARAECFNVVEHVAVQAGVLVIAAFGARQGRRGWRQRHGRDSGIEARSYTAPGELEGVA